MQATGMMFGMMQDNNGRGIHASLDPAMVLFHNII